MIRLVFTPLEAKAIERAIGAVMQQHGSPEHLPRELLSLVSAYRKVVQSIHDRESFDRALQKKKESSYD